MIYSLILVLCYLIGTVPFGFILVKIAGKGDVRESGSGATGATNVTRRAGKGLGILTLALDAAKGAAAVSLARFLAPADAAGSWVIALSALAVVAGHCFPLWLGFRGGKGVATGLGAFLVLYPKAIAVCAVVFLPVVLFTRYVSLASMFAAITVPVSVLLLTRTDTSPRHEVTVLMVSSTLAASLIIFMHRENLKRLAQGTENKLFQSHEGSLVRTKGKSKN
jgi:glycerol-3-phosphate acyltransferase PlsY